MTHKKSSSPPGQYASAFIGDPEKILSQHGDKDLWNEIELLRYMNLVVLQNMNARKKKLTFYDYLSTLRAMTYSAGRIAHLVDVQYRVFNPRLQLEQSHQQQMESMYSRIVKVAELLMGEKRVEEIQVDALMQVAHDQNGGQP